MCAFERLVCFKVSSLFARIIAFCASEGLVPWMYEHVLFSIRSKCRGVVTLCAFERLFPRMCSFVSLQSTGNGARIVAVCATERLSPWMGPHVCCEGISPCARVIAQCAIERFSPRMGSHVCLENGSSFATVVALFANEKFAAITLRLNDITRYVDSLHFCDRPSSEVERQLIAKVVRIIKECQWKVKVITLSDSDASRFEMFQKFYNTTFFNQKFYTLKRVYQDYFWWQ